MEDWKIGGLESLFNFRKLGCLDIKIFLILQNEENLASKHTASYLF